MVTCAEFKGSRRGVQRKFEKKNCVHLFWPLIYREDTKGRFRKTAALAHVPSFQFSFWGNMRTDPRSGFPMELGAPEGATTLLCFPSAPDPLFKASEAPVATPAGHPVKHRLSFVPGNIRMYPDEHVYFPGLGREHIHFFSPVNQLVVPALGMVLRLFFRNNLARPKNTSKNTINNLARLLK